MLYAGKFIRSASNVLNINQVSNDPSSKTVLCHCNFLSDTSVVRKGYNLVTNLCIKAQRVWLGVYEDTHAGIHILFHIQPHSAVEHRCKQY